MEAGFVLRSVDTRALGFLRVSCGQHTEKAKEVRGLNANGNKPWKAPQYAVDAQPGVES